MKQRQPIFIIGEGSTEQHYFKHLKRKLGYKIQVRPRLFSSKNDISHIEKRTDKLLEEDVFVICVFDADVSERSAKEKQKLDKLKSKYKRRKKVLLCDSMPSIEFWFLLHFRNTHKPFDNAHQLVEELREHIGGYKKKEKFLKTDAWVKPLIERKDKAVAHAREVEGREGSYSNVYKGIEFIEKHLK